MRQPRRLSAVPFTTAIATLAVAGCLAAVATAQVPPPPPGSLPPQASDDARLGGSMAQEVRRLADDIVTDLGQTALGRNASQDARELAQALDEFRENRREGVDPIALRQRYSAIQSGWESLRAQLSNRQVVTPVIARDLDRIAGVNAQLSRTLGLNALPQDYYNTGGGVAPAGSGQTRRLAHALVDRAEGLALAVQTELGRDPDAAGLIADARSLAREADAWHDSLRVDTTPGVAARSFSPVDALADRVERVVTAGRMPPRVVAAWQAFAAVEVLLHRDLRSDAQQPAITAPVPGVVAVAPSVAYTIPGLTAPASSPFPPPSLTLATLTDQLVAQTNDFVRVFAPTAGAVPEGQFILGDAQRLAEASAGFRENVARNADTNTLALNFRDVDAIWQRLARRVNRIARGRMGPNILQVQKIGGTTEVIHRALGLPGYAPVIAPY